MDDRQKTREQLIQELHDARQRIAEFESRNTVPQQSEEQDRDSNPYKQAEETLRFQAQLLDAVGQSIIATDLTGTIIYWNKAAETLYGWIASEAIGQPISKIVPEPTAEQASEIMAQLVKGETWAGEFTVQNKDGTLFPVIVSDTPVYDQAGNLSAILGISTDIRKQKQVENALRESEAKLLKAQQITRLGSYSRDVQKNTVEWSDTLKEILAVGDAEPDYDLFISRIHPDDYTKVNEQAKYAVEHCQSLTIEYRILRPDGSIIYVRDSSECECDDDGNVIRIFGVSQNITGQKLAEITLRESEEQLKRTVRAGNIGLWEWNLITNEVYFSPEWKHHIGYEDHEIPDEFSEWQDRVHPDDLERTLQNIQAFIDNPRDNYYQNEFRLRHKNGTYRWILAQADVMRDEHGKPLRMMGSHIDVTIRKEAQKREQDLAQERYRMKILTDFITQTSHEFRNPLAVISTSGYFLGKLSDSKDQQKRVKKIEEQVNNLTNLVEMMTTMSKLDSIHQLDKEAFDICELIESIVAKCQAATNSNQIDYPTNQDIQQLALNGNEYYIRQAIEHLIDNAIRFSTENETVTIQMNSNDDELMIEVIDTGTGIPEELLPRIFERFYRSDTAGKTRGFGLGLPIARRIAELHQGRIEVKSETNKGSTFKFILPLD